MHVVYMGRGPGKQWQGHEGDRKGGVIKQVTTVGKRGSDLLERPGSQSGACLLGNGGGRGLFLRHWLRAVPWMC